MTAGDDQIETAPGSATPYHFGPFLLDVAERRLTRDGATVELNSRYLDALTLMVVEPGKLISKDRFMAEVWKGIPVTDEALTQAIRSLRKALGDDAARPRFIETTPKHGYRFIAAVSRFSPERPLADSDTPPAEMQAILDRLQPPSGTADAVPMATPPARDWPAKDWRRARVISAAGMIGGGGAGLLGGLIYGLIGASAAQEAGSGSSAVLVLAGLMMWVGLVGGAGVGVGIAGANLKADRPSPWTVLGAGLGGLMIGGLVKLIGTDAFTLLFGQSPGAITGAGEGLVLGAGIGLGAWLSSLGSERFRARLGLAIGAVIGAISGLAIALMGGRLMAGSLVEIATRFPNSRLPMDALGSLFGEVGFGPTTRMISAALEGSLFSASVVAAMALAWRSLERDTRS